MSEERFTCIKQIVKTVHLTLSPKYISNEIAGISEILDSWKRQYIQQLNGVVVNYRNISLASRSGFININKAFVYYDATATFDLFCPTLGDIVKGKINRISREHIGCLIEGTINVTILRCKETAQEISKFVYLDREILFKITHFVFEHNAIRVNGLITSECVQLMEELFPVINENDTCLESASDFDSTSVNELSYNISANKRVIYDLSSEEEAANNVAISAVTNNKLTASSTSHSSDDDMPSISKSVNKASDAEMLETFEFNPMDESNELSVKLKKSKKRKDTSENTSSGKNPKKKKKCEEGTKLSQVLVSGKKMKKKKKHKENPLEKKSKRNKHTPNMTNLNDIQSTFAGSESFNHILKSIKSEPESVLESDSLEVRGKKRKREPSPMLLDVTEKLQIKKKKHTKDKIKHRDKSKSKSSKKNRKLVASGDILKKDKKNAHKKKHSKKDEKRKKNKLKHSSHNKDECDKSNGNLTIVEDSVANDNIVLSTIKSEFN